ncbi:MAG TPA: hypothetical protein VMW65_06715 [Chloroflexota bacterium]|nr:hypothetical protein [Chloroflexota bacterium]
MHVSLAERWSPGRPMMLLALMFVVGIGMGWVVTRPFANTAPQHVTSVDYVTVVAQLYQRDHNATVARERLAILGSPTNLVQQALASAQSGQLTEPSDRASLVGLAQALQVPVDSSLALSPSPASTVTSGTAPGTADSTSNAASASIAASAASTATASSGTSADSSSKSSASGHISPLGPIVAFLLAFALGGVVLMRTAGLSLPGLDFLEGLSFRLPTLGSMRPSGSRRSVRASRLDDAAFRRPTGSGTGYASGEVDDDSDDEAVDEAPRREYGRTGVVSSAVGRTDASRAEAYRSNPRRGEAPLVDRPIARQAPVTERPVARPPSMTRNRPAATRPPPRRLSFQSHYQLGDEGFDEIHTVTDPQTGALVAACGLNCALANRQGGASRCFAFSAWLQDYVGDDQLQAVGLISPGALDRERDQIDNWAQTGDIAGILAAEEGASTELKTDTLITTINVVEAEYGSAGGISDAYLSSLVVRFDVRRIED